MVGDWEVIQLGILRIKFRKVAFSPANYRSLLARFSVPIWQNFHAAT
jgi:hypothetical protein